MNNVEILQNRSIIEIEGLDRKKFLQGLITNDINKLEENKLIYSAMLNHQGRFLYDFFLFEKNETIFIDCSLERVDEIFKKFSFYKLKSQIQIKKNSNYFVIFSFNNFNKNLLQDDEIQMFDDPRNNNLGKRIYAKTSSHFVTENKIDNENSKYHFQRISLKIPEGEHDLTYEKSIIAEFGFDNLSAVDYQKGCYIGQELTARTHYQGEVRKKLFHITVDSLRSIEKNHEISCASVAVGVVLSSVFYQEKLHALALIKDQNLLSNFSDNKNIYQVSDCKINFLN